MRFRSIAIWAFTAAFCTSLAHAQSKDLRKPAERIINMRAIVFSPDGRLLAAASGEPEDAGEVVVWDAKTNVVRWRHKIDRGMPALTFSPDGKTLAVGSFTENCLLFAADTGRPLPPLPGHGKAARSVAFSPDGATLAVGSYDKSIRLWDWRAGTVLKTLEGHTEFVNFLAYLPGGARLASGDRDGGAIIWDHAKAAPLHQWERRASPIAFDPQGKWLITAGNDGTVTIRSLDDYEKTLAHYDNIYAYQTLVVHPSGNAFASNAGWSAVLDIFPIELRSATPADDKRATQLMALWDDDSYEVREKASRELIALGPPIKPLLTKAANDGSSAESRIRAREALRQLGQPKPVAQLRGHEENVACAAFSPDGQFVAVGGRDGRVLIWETVNYRLTTTLKWSKGD
jgi:WD40 repeat protein